MGVCAGHPKEEDCLVFELTQSGDGAEGGGQAPGCPPQRPCWPSSLSTQPRADVVTRQDRHRVATETARPRGTTTFAAWPFTLLDGGLQEPICLSGHKPFAEEQRPAGPVCARHFTSVLTGRPRDRCRHCPALEMGNRNSAWWWQWGGNSSPGQGGAGQEVMGPEPPDGSPDPQLPVALGRKPDTLHPIGWGLEGRAYGARAGWLEPVRQLQLRHQRRPDVAGRRADVAGRRVKA